MTKQELYWADREQANMLQNVLDQKALDDTIKEINRKAAEDAEGLLFEWYGKYAGKTGLTYEDARKAASEADIKALAERAKQYVADKDFSDEANEAMALYNLSMKSSRMELLEATFNERFFEYFDQTERAVYSGLTQTARDALREQAGIFGEFMQSDEEMKRLSDFIVKSSYMGNTFSERIWGYNQAVKSDLDKALRRGLMLGENVAAQAKKVADTYGRAQWEALRLLRTESARVRTQARHESFERLGYEFFKWVPRGNPCPACLKLVQDSDAEPFPIKGGQMPPLHPNCWCSTAPVVTDDEMDLARTDAEFEKKWEQAANGDPAMRSYFEGLYQKKAKWEWKDLIAEEKKRAKRTPKATSKVTAESELKRKIDEIKSRVSGRPTEDQLKEAGRLVRDDYQVALKNTVGNVEIDKALKYEDDLFRMRDESLAERSRLFDIAKDLTPGTPEYDDIYNQIQLRAKEWRDISRKLADNTRDLEMLRVKMFDESLLTLKNTLSEVREMGSGKIDLSKHVTSRSPMKKVVANAYEVYPRSWIEKSVDYGTLTPKKVSRGYYDHFNEEIAISGTGGKQSTTTAIHELGHRFERVVPGILEMEEEFYNRRTAGESLQWLGSGYDKAEKTRFDNFIEPYMGKDYGKTAYELVSMGFQYAYTDPEKLMKDPDMADWILGMLSLVE